MEVSVLFTFYDGDDISTVSASNCYAAKEPIFVNRQVIKIQDLFHCMILLIVYCLISDSANVRFNRPCIQTTFCVSEIKACKQEYGQT